MPHGSEPLLFNRFLYNVNEDIEGMPASLLMIKRGGHQDSKRPQLARTIKQN